MNFFLFGAVRTKFYNASKYLLDKNTVLYNFYKLYFWGWKAEIFCDCIR